MWFNVRQLYECKVVDSLWFVVEHVLIVEVTCVFRC